MVYSQKVSRIQWRIIETKRPPANKINIAKNAQMNIIIDISENLNIKKKPYFWFVSFIPKNHHIVFQQMKSVFIY